MEESSLLKEALFPEKAFKRAKEKEPTSLRDRNDDGDPLDFKMHPSLFFVRKLSE